MANKEVDVIDVAPLALFPVFAALTLGAITLEFSLFGSWSFTDMLWSGSGVQITAAGLIATASAILIVATNELLNHKEIPDDRPAMAAYLAGIVIIFGVVPLYMLMPAVRTLVASHDIINAGLLILQSGSVGYVAWWR